MAKTAPLSYANVLDPVALGVGLLSCIAYYGWFEGRFGAGLGKFGFGLRVVRDGGEAPGVPRAVARSVAFLLPTSLGELIFLLAGQGLDWSIETASLLSIAGQALGAFALFAAARRTNGYLALHDRWTGTRVASVSNRTAPVDAEPPLAGLRPRATGERIGPFDLVESAESLPDGVRLGHDDRLRRPVWIHQVAPGTAPVPSARRDLARATRLRWIGGARGPTAAANWDAYEAADGKPFAAVCDRPRDWSLVRGWLSQLVGELDAAAGDGTGGVREISDLWLTRSSDLKVTDFRARGAIGRDADADVDLVLSVATTALEGTGTSALGRRRPQTRLPHQARQFFADLFEDRLAITSCADRLRDLAGQPPALTTASRSRPMVIVGAPLLVASTIFLLLGIMFEPGRISQLFQERDTLSIVLHRFEALDGGTTAAYTEELADLRIVAAHRLRELSKQFDRLASTGSAPEAAILRRLEARARQAPGQPPLLSAHDRALAIRVVGSGTASVEEAVTREAEGRLRPLLAAPERFGLSPRRPRPLPFVTFAMLVPIFLWSAAAAVATLTAFAFGGGLSFRLAGIEVVTSNGDPASRVRCLCRALLAWSPVYLAGGIAFMLRGAANPGLGYSIVVLLAGLFSAGAMVALRSPERGWQDRLAGTHLVPR
jgi:uncharacterized RDD family membrane protein YckC